MATEYIETDLLHAALNRDAKEAKRLIRLMNNFERRTLRSAILDIDEWINDVDRDEKETALGTGKEASHG